MATTPYKMFYWSACQKFWGRAGGIVLTLDHAGVEYTIEEPDKAPANVGFAVPMITLPSGQTMAQTPAILDVLGEAHGLNGKTLAEKIACKQCVMDMNDVASDAIIGKLKDDRADKWFSHLEQKLEHNKFMISNEPTVADFHGVFAYEWVLKKYGEPDGDKYPKLTQWWKDMAQVPAVKKMKTSGIPMNPF